MPGIPPHLNQVACRLHCPGVCPYWAHRRQGRWRASSLGASTLNRRPRMVMPLKMAFEVDSSSSKKMRTICVLIPSVDRIRFRWRNLVPVAVSSSASSSSVISGSTPLITAFQFSLRLAGIFLPCWGCFGISYDVWGPKEVGGTVSMNLATVSLSRNSKVDICVLAP